MITHAWAIVIGLAVSIFGTSQLNPTDLVGRRFEARVIKVLDGDTVDARLQSGRVVRVRVFGIDSPEIGEPSAGDALRFARILLFDKVVTIEGRDVDRYRRLVGTVAVSGADAALELLKAGLACHFRQYSQEPSYQAAEHFAQLRQIGFWAANAPKPRCTGSAPPAMPLAQSLVGNSSSRVYHTTTCKNASCKNCSIKFDSIDEAHRAGFRPARDCFR